MHVKSLQTLSSCAQHVTFWLMIINIVTDKWCETSMPRWQKCIASARWNLSCNSNSAQLSDMRRRPCCTVPHHNIYTYHCRHVHISLSTCTHITVISLSTCTHITVISLSTCTHITVDVYTYHCQRVHISLSTCTHITVDVYTYHCQCVQLLL